MRTARNLPAHELIGLEAEVVRSSCSNLMGKSGKVVDETKNTLVFGKGNRQFTIPKKSAMFRFVLPSGETCLVKGDEIMYAPEERTKRLAQKLRI
ncbi:MAG: ribonuclease P protein subunit [Candidatus Micrarchaeota archaeon]|nr:ribonuclease P protein subunit [Candidatus Micrarchaeota archaeon]